MGGNLELLLPHYKRYRYTGKRNVCTIRRLFTALMKYEQKLHRRTYHFTKYSLDKTESKNSRQYVREGHIKKCHLYSK